MATHSRPTVTQAQQILRDLNRAKESLDSFLDVEDMSDCALSTEAREAVAGYLSSWVSSPLDVALRRLQRAIEGQPYSSLEG
jgi:hypothetical protein